VNYWVFANEVAALRTTGSNKKLEFATQYLPSLINLGGKLPESSIAPVTKTKPLALHLVVGL